MDFLGWFRDGIWGVVSGCFGSGAFGAVVLSFWGGNVGAWFLGCFGVCACVFVFVLRWGFGAWLSFGWWCFVV